MRTFTFNDQPPELSEVQRLVGGYVEIVELDDQRQMLVDEDGRAKNLAPNLEASALAGFTIMGNAVILSGTARWSNES